MSEDHPAAALIHAFHADLSHLFAGTDDREAVWQRLTRVTPADMTLVYPSGERLSGAAFLQSIADRYGMSPGFVAFISELQLVHGDAHHAAVAYVEEQRGARHSAERNRRSAFAWLRQQEGQWQWRYIQETALPPEQDAPSS